MTSSAISSPGSATAAEAKPASADVAFLGVALVAHFVFGLVLRVVPAVAALHAVVAFAACIVIATTRSRRETVFAIGYLAGSEVVWRMTHSPVPVEFGKYAVAAVALIGALRWRCRRNRLLALIYLGVLVPSAVLTIVNADPDRARQLLSFNLSGPLALTTCVIFMSEARLTMRDVRLAFFAFIAPVVIIATLSLFSTTAKEAIEFKNGSNFDTSAGFGPNQVAAALGLSVLMLVLMTFDRAMPLAARILMLVLALVFTAQSLLTFSRAGIGMALVSFGGAVLFLVRERRTRITLVVVAGLLFAIGNWVIVPRLEEFTQGKLGERYSSLRTSRTEIAQIDLQIFADSPIIGVGPGMAEPVRQEFGVIAAAHTEYTRLLAEHGILGAAAILLLAAISWRAFRLARGPRANALVVAMVMWALLFLLIDAMRMGAPGFVLGLACAIAYSSKPQPLRPAAQAA